MDSTFLFQRKAMSLQRNGYRKILHFQQITISYASNRYGAKTYKWLAYSKSCNGVYCVTCVLFGKEISQLNVVKLSAFYKGPFYDWKHAIQRFKETCVKCNT